MTNKLSLLLKKYSVPAIFLVFALTMFYIGLSSKQDTTYTLATLLMFLASILSFLYSSGKISSRLLSILGIGAGLFAAITLYTSYNSVSKEVKHQQEYEKMVAIAQSNLRDIRTAQKTYMETNGKYAKTFDELIQFIETGKVPFVVAEGVVPSRKISPEERAILYGDNRPIDVNMTELEALKLASRPNPSADLVGFKRDTVMRDFKEMKYLNSSAIKAREKAGLPKFDSKSLPFIPMSNGKKWKIETRDSVLVMETKTPTILVSGTLPIAKIQGTKPEMMSFGKLTSSDTGGSWEQ